ncbi:hypothetical protein [Nocardia seriolae]|uniref:Uncharacterized protein n=1 Tax=Nocardia seriolae TaxID=37332 RepID=A0A0B8NJM0_9NOCA|nr:hypothetical protein [Nocardia seriolae]APA99264.1 hypothetical protein NS506_05218 [Nocardia seriolae]MTJ63341.1 hypothetical protein [Nocardia seriolae]MTJ71218.1 hypothetical protein [Nocardia seriolae]MTJ88857.1 hypothetical protein [Nocardia seriolae]MTK32839.1 hypothetical protein [Nocardia seriolae]
MRTLVLKSCAVAAIVTGLGAGPALAAPVVLQPAAPEAADVTPVAGLVPETGSAGVLNTITCGLKTLSASMPCLYT